jgi:hypothetical protein
VVVVTLHGTDERDEGHRTWGSGSLVKNEVWGLGKHFESVEGILEMAHGVRTYDGAHVALMDSPVSVGQHLGSASLVVSLLVHLSASPSEIPSVNLSADRHRGHDWTSDGLAEAEERAPKMVAGWDADDYGKTSCRYSPAKAHDGCCA